jgi:hypothetical protein
MRLLKLLAPLHARACGSALSGNAKTSPQSLSPIKPYAIDGGCDQGADEHGEGNTEENFAAYH